MKSPLLKHLNALWQDLQNAEIWWEIVALAACLAAAWFIAGVLRKKFAAVANGWSLGGEFGAGGLDRLTFPLTALLLVSIVRSVMEPFQPVNLLSLALPLLTAFALVRGTVYMLRYTFRREALVAWERWIALGVWLVVALYFTGFLGDLTAALERVHFPVAKQKISIYAVMQAVFWVALTMLVALWAAAALERRLMKSTSIEPNLGLALGRFFKAMLLLLAVLASLGIAGIDLTVLSVFGGALGVGLGFGLQKIASNYISGYIILLDRSIRIGDMIQVDKHTGRVTQINTRYSVLQALDGTEAIVPNETLVSQPVQNLSFTSKQVRHAVQVQVAYDTDLEKVKALLINVALSNERVQKTPAPMVFLTAFADSGINLELGFWIIDPESGVLNVRSELNFAIWEAFKREKVSIPFPQREIRMLNVPQTGNI
jgi:small-conductance mechanosensitive channel